MLLITPSDGWSVNSPIDAPREEAEPNEPLSQTLNSETLCSFHKDYCQTSQVVRRVFVGIFSFSDQGLA